MQKRIVIQPRPRAWLEGSILQPYLSQYGEHLRRRRYAPNTQRAYLRCVAHFAHWLTQERHDLAAIGQGAVVRFLSEHLPACTCPDPVRRFRHELQAALGHLLEVLEAGGVPLQYPARNSAIERELTRFDTHMRDVWGLAESTRRRRCRVVGEFLVEHFGERPISMTTVKATSIRRFILGEQGRGTAAVAAIGVTIACYLRFRSISGDRVNELKAAIPRVARWRLASLPEVLTDTEIDELLSSFDQSFPSRLRAYAMVRCLIDLGLRSGEVVKLQLDDINWADGTITLLAPRADGLMLCPCRPQRERRLQLICAKSGPRRRTEPYLFATSHPTMNRSRPRASNAQCWPATEDVDGREPVSIFSATARPVDFCAPARG